MSYRADKHVIDAHTDGHTDRLMQATTKCQSLKQNNNGPANDAALLNAKIFIGNSDDQAMRV